MIIEIHLSNFFSIKDEIVLDLRAGNSKSIKTINLEDNIFDYKGDKILKSVALYGANASGKSNIINAIRFCCLMIIESHLHNENSVFNFNPFKYSGYVNKPSNFFIRFVCNEIEYEYSFTLTKNEIIKESLYYNPNNRRAKIFTRNETIKGLKKQKYSFGNAIKRPFDVAENTSSKTLYISRASQMDRPLCKEIYTYFAESFSIGNLLTNLSSFESVFTENKSLILKALQIADSDIIDIFLNKEEITVKQLNASTPDKTLTITDNKRDLFKFTTYHKFSTDVAFDFDTEESEGTRKILSYLMFILDIVKKNKIFLIDEIESSLHIRIVEFIMKLFYASNSAQLIFTTHNTKLLDLNKIRKDQIYFVNKKIDASTELYSLYDYKDFRETMDLEKAYLQGRFDAIPFIDDSIANIKNMIYGK
jgi:uncharacterized protein